MRKTLLAACSTSAAIAAVAAMWCATAAAATGNWKEYGYPQDGFAISAPAAPTSEKKTMRAAGGSTAADIYTMPTGKTGAFMVIVHMRNDADHRSDQEILDEARVGVLREASAMVLVQSNATLGRYRGAQLELESTLPSGKSRRVRDRFFVVGRKLYQLVAVAAPGEALPSDTDRWFESFRLLGEGDR